MGKSVFLKVLGILAAVFFLAKLVIAFWALNRGLDIIDDGFDLFQFNQPYNYRNQVMPMFLMMNRAFPEGFFTVVNTRIIKIIAELVIAGVLLITFARVMDKKLNWQVAAVFSVFTFTDVFQRCFEYNQASYLLAVLINCSFIYAFSSKKVWVAKLLPLVLFAGGALTALIFVCKFPTLVFSLALSVFIVVLYRQYTIANVVGFIIGLLVVYAWGISKQFYVMHFLQMALKANKMVGFNDAYGRIFTDLGITIVPFVIVAVLMLVLIPKLKSPAQFGRLVLVLVVVQFILTALHITDLKMNDFYRQSILFMLLLALAIFSYKQFFLRVGWLSGFSAQQLGVIVVYILLPAFVTAGSMTNAFESASKFLLPWGVLLTWFLLESDFPLKPVFVALTVMVFTAHFFYYYCYRPWGLNAPIWQQTVAVKSMKGEELYFDAPTAKFFQSVNQVYFKDQHAPINNMVVLDVFAGLNYWLNTPSAGSPFYCPNDSRDHIAYNIYRLSGWVAAKNPKPDMFISRRMLQGDFRTYIDTSSINFSASYYLLDSIPDAFESDKSYDPGTFGPNLYFYRLKQ